MSTVTQQNNNNNNNNNQSAIEPIQEIGRRITAVTEDTSFSTISAALQMGNVVAFWATFDAM